jgi:hypothetical protein
MLDTRYSMLVSGCWLLDGIYIAGCEQRVTRQSAYLFAKNMADTVTVQSQRAKSEEGGASETSYEKSFLNFL